MTQLINKDSLKAKLTWMFSHDVVSVDNILKAIDEESTVEAIPVEDINTMYDAAIMVRDMFEKNTYSWNAADNQALGVKLVLSICEEENRNG